MEILGVALFWLTLKFATGSAAPCFSDSDCKFGGKCDPVHKECSCVFYCGKYKAQELICSWRRYPMTKCQALSDACKKQENVDIKPYAWEEYLRLRSCKRVESTSPDEFCPNQSYCNGNGICIQKRGLNQRYCRCASRFVGERCQIKLAPESETVSRQRHSGLIIGPIPMTALLIVSITILTTSVFYVRNRSSKPNKAEDTIAGSTKAFETTCVKIIQHV